MSKMRVHGIEIPNANVFEILLHNFPDMIHSIDDAGNIVYTNKAAETLLGYTHDELLSMNICDLYPEELRAVVEEGFSDLKEKGEKTVPESRLQAKDGTKIPVEIRSFAIYGDDGSFIRTFSILRDIRKMKELQNELVHAGRLAAIGELASGVAHDINNPLMVITMANRMVSKSLDDLGAANGKKLEEVRSQTEAMKRASKSIQKLSEHLRDFSRGVAEDYESVDLSKVADDALFLTNNKISKSGVTVNGEIRKGLYFVSGCPNHLEQVLVNLIANACDAMADQPRRELKLSIEECRHDGADCWRFDITDTGTGIPEGKAEDIFHSFFTTKEKGKGTGLGLSISRGIIRDHKGDIEVSSTVGEGTAFSVYLPKLKQ